MLFLLWSLTWNYNYKDRTKELRKKGYTGRRLGPKQMTTDTAVRVTRIVSQEKSETTQKLPSMQIPRTDIRDYSSFGKHPLRRLSGDPG